MTDHTGDDGARGGTLRVALLMVGGGLVLLAPYVAMQFTGEVNWSPTDFATAAGMLIFAGTALELGLRRSANVAYRAGMALLVLTALFMVWIALAVGIVGEPMDIADLMYLGVLAVAFAGALVSRFRAGGMAKAMTAAAVACAAVAGVVLIGRLSTNTLQVLGLNGLFAALFLAAAWLFAAAARQRR